MSETSRPCNGCGEARAIELLYRKGEYPIVRCRTCRLVYSQALPSGAALAAIYSAGFFQVGEKFAAAHPDAGNAASRVDRLLVLPGLGRDRWLDVGCATGNFMLAARPWVSEMRGIEVSAYAADRARQRGLRHVIEGDVLHVDPGASRFDLITMWDLLEHVPDPLATLRKAWGHLGAGGYLVLSTGDIESVTARIMGRFWHLMIPPRHLYFFSPVSIRCLLVRAGFDVVSVARPGKRVPLDFMVWKLASLFVPAARPLALRVGRTLGLGRVAPFVNFRDIMTVVARKPDAGGRAPRAGTPAAGRAGRDHDPTRS